MAFENDAFIGAVLPAHIALGILGLVLGVLAMGARKGGALHRRAGRGFVLVVILVAVTGTALLVDPVFATVDFALFAQERGLLAIVEAAHYGELLFVFFTLVTVYGAVTGARLWTLVGGARDGRFAGRTIDWAFALASMPLTLLFLTIGIVDVVRVQRYGLEILAYAGLFLGLLALDLLVMARRPLLAGRPWWALHMAKMMAAFSALAYALYLRHRLELPEPLQIHGFGAILLVLLMAGSVLVHRRRGPAPVAGPSR